MNDLGHKQLYELFVKSIRMAEVKMIKRIEKMISVDIGGNFINLH